MARNAKVIGLATVQSVEARKDESTGLVYTDFTLVFSEVWKGTPREPFILAKAGGTFGGQRSTIAGREYRLGVGQALVVFASESLGNRYAAIGLRQGLYRIGNGDDPMLFRVSEYPERMGESSPLRLSALREQVFRVIPRPGTPGKTAPPPSADAPAQERSPIVPSRPSLPAPSPAEPGCGRAAGASSRVWAVLGLGIVAAVAIFLNLRRK